MRLSRHTTLTQPHGTVHLFWRCHNKEFLLKATEIKELFFKCLIFGLNHRSSNNSVKLHAFCFMNNHVHKQMSYDNGSTSLSSFMRVTNGLFGLLFNKKSGRTGKVANERPKTPLIGDQESQMRVHFYIEANPIRAHITTLSKLKFFRWSSYRYYAFGVVDEITKHLTPPDWYTALGTNNIERQIEYRKLFRKYLEKSLSNWIPFLKRFIGNNSWIATQEHRLAALRAGTGSRNDDELRKDAPS